MKTLRLFLFVSLFFMISCGSYTKWQYNVSKYDIEFEKLRYSLDENKQIKTVIGYLKSDTTIFGFPCEKNWVHFNNEWQLKLFCLSENFLISDNVFTKGTWIRIRHNKEIICVFPTDTIVQGYYCKGGGGVKGIQTLFYKNGKLKSFFTNNDVEISGILCKKGVLNSIVLYRNGFLKECSLAETQTIRGREYKKNTRISFDLEGNVIQK